MTSRPPARKRPATPPDRTGVRVNLTLPREVVAVLDRIEAATGTGRATFIREVLIEGAPLYAQMAEALELAKSRNLDAFKVMNRTLSAMTEQTDQLKLDIRSAHRRARRKKSA